MATVLRLGRHAQRLRGAPGWSPTAVIRQACSGLTNVHDFFALPRVRSSVTLWPDRVICDGPVRAAALPGQHGASSAAHAISVIFRMEEP
jgi:hypothetical protein